MPSTSTSPNRRRSRRAEGSDRRETRELLLDAALAVFERERFAGYTVHAVVAESGISLGSLYHHFGSMDGLSAALYGRCMARLLEAVADAAEAARGARAVIVAIVRSYLAFVARERAAAMFIHAAPSAAFLSEHATAIAAEKAPRLERIAAAVRPHVRSGAIVAMPEPLLEMLLIGPVAEVTRRWLAGA
ncbi:MAG TPA: TetR family transcriptional regulator, partial [Sandaracinaceae bacterium]